MVLGQAEELARRLAAQGDLTGTLVTMLADQNQALLAEMQKQSGLLDRVFNELSILRHYMAGPFFWQTYDAATQGITTPYSVAAGASVPLMPLSRGPGSLYFISATCSADTFTISIISDNISSDIKAKNLIEGSFISPVQMIATMPQVDYSNGLITMAVWPGDSFGYSSFQNGRVVLTNTGSSAFNLLSFFVRFKQFAPTTQTEEAFFQSQR